MKNNYMRAHMCTYTN